MFTQSIVLKSVGRKGRDNIKSVLIIKPKLALRAFWGPECVENPWKSTAVLGRFPSSSQSSKPCPAYWCWDHQWWSDAAIIAAVLFSGIFSSVCKVRPLPSKCFLLLFVHKSPFKDNRMAWQVQCSTGVITYRLSTLVSLICKMEKQTECESSVCKEHCKMKYIYMKKYFVHRKQCCTETGDALVVGS